MEYEHKTGPKISVLLPVCGEARYLAETLESVFAQTLSCFEVLVVCDKLSHDTAEYLQSVKDNRMRILAGPGAGLAGALNFGLQQAAGEYIARLDADDIAVPDRFRMQADYLDTHPETVLCGGWQQYFGNSVFLQKPAEEPAQCKANLLFRCELCHSTIMLRKAFFLKHGLFYDAAFAAEDFELWTRTADIGIIANIPAVLGFYRKSGDNITEAKKNRLIREQGDIVANTLARNLGISLTPAQKVFFYGWENPFFNPSLLPLLDDRETAWKELETLLRSIWETNLLIRAYDETALLQAINTEWQYLRYDRPVCFPFEVQSIEEVFRKRNTFDVFLLRLKQFDMQYPSAKSKYEEIKKRISRKKTET